MGQMIGTAAQAYSDLFAPEAFVLLCSLFLVIYEWRDAETPSIADLGARIGVVGLGWVVAFVIYQGIPRAVETVPEWGSDVAGSVGLAVGMALIGAVWRVRNWGSLVPGFVLALLAVTAPHLLIRPLWDVSGHVLYAATPAGYLLLVDRRFGPLAVVALGMVLARPLAGAHTWTQSIGGLALAVAVLVAVTRLWDLADVRTGTAPIRP